MNFDDVVRTRRSVRAFKPDGVPDERIRALLEAARLAPSGLNAQPWRFVVVKDAGARRQLAGATPSRFVADAPAVIVCCVDREAFSRVAEEYRRLLTDAAVASEQLTISSSVAITYLLLKAVDIGLSSCWIGLFDEAKVRAVAGIGGRYAVKALLPVGYAAEPPAPTPRLPADELLLATIG